jgi:hypothetical protein
MTISRGDRYYCSARREKSTCNADRGIGAAELEQRVLDGLRDILLGNERLINEFTAEFKRELARLRKEGMGGPPVWQALQIFFPSGLCGYLLGALLQRPDRGFPPYLPWVTRRRAAS